MRSAASGTDPWTLFRRNTEQDMRIHRRRCVRRHRVCRWNPAETVRQGGWRSPFLHARIGR